MPIILRFRSLYILLACSCLQVVQAQPPKVKSVTSMKAEQERVIDTLKSLGFSVQQIHPAGHGVWKVEIQGFDPAKATAGFKGVVKGPVLSFVNPGRVKAARSGASGPAGVAPGGTRASGDATGGSGQGGADGATGGRDSGGLPGASEGGGSATGGGKDPGPAPATGGGRSLQVSIGADGSLSIDKAGLQTLGLAADLGRVQGTNLHIR